MACNKNISPPAKASNKNIVPQFPFIAAPTPRNTGRRHTIIKIIDIKGSNPNI